MLEKLITNLKNSLPEAIRKKMGMSEESVDEEDSEATEVNELQKYESDDASETSAEDKKKKQTSMIIRVVVILGLGYYALDEFVLKKEVPEQSIDQMIAKNAGKRKRKKPADAAADPASAQAIAAAKTAAENPASTQANTDAGITAEETAPKDPPIENVNILNKTDTASSDSSPEAQMQIETPVTETEPEVTQSKVVDVSVDKKLDQLVDNVDQSPSTMAEEITIPSQPQTPEVSSHTDPAPKTKTSMASKIVEEVTETLPPAYDQVGRGLVYNCKDKYWACVDKPAYVHCNKNMKWNKAKGNNMECVVQNIYNSDEDCAKIQKYNVSTSVATNFCQGN